MSESTKVPDSQLRILNSIKGTELNLSIVLMEQRFPIGELMGLSPGGVLLFDQPAEAPATLCVNGKEFAKGEIVQVGEHYGIQLQNILSDASAS